jgi:hypothetical protein
MMSEQEEIDRICDGFEDAMHSSSPKTIEDILHQSPHCETKPLLEQLLLAELEYRNRSPSTPTKEEYYERFPKHPEIVEKCFYIAEKLFRSGNSPPNRLVPRNREPPLSPDSPPAMTLSICEGCRPPRVITLEPDTSVIVGRAPDADIQFPDDPGVSRIHCRIDTKNDICWVSDLNSTRGTRLNGHRISSMPFRPGDFLQISEVRIQLCCKEASLPTCSPEAANTIIPCQNRPTSFHIKGYSGFELIGEGTFSWVYKATCVTHGHARAIKVLKTKDEHCIASLQKFFREALIHKKLSHRHVVKCFDAGTSGKNFYLVLENIENIDLFPRLQNISQEQRVRICVGVICQALSGISYIHRQGIIHRDIKPGNLLIQSHNDKIHVKVADFGLAKYVTDDGFTETGQKFGSIEFMSPEQMQNPKFLSTASDIYSVAACLYYLLSGVFPYPESIESASPPKRMAAILCSEPVRIEERMPSIPKVLAEIVHRGLSKSAASRFRTAQEMKKALTSFLRRYREELAGVQREPESLASAEDGHR